MRASVALGLVGLLVAGCSLAPKGPAAAHGLPIDAGPRPSDEECARMIRADVAAAKRIRAELGTKGVASDDAAIRAAAGDPTADLATLGIPITADEKKSIETSGFGLDAHSALSFLVEAGAPERFGGEWISPPGTDRYVVAIVGADPATLARARCIEGPNTNYVNARRSLAEGRDLQNRITADWQALAAEGIRLVSVAYDVTTGLVVVGVTGVTDPIRARLQERYGDVDVQEAGPIVPL